MLSKTAEHGPPVVVFSIVPILMMVFGYLLMKHLVFDMGDALIVRVGSEQERIALAEIINVSYSPLINPPRVTLTLRHP